MDKPKPRRKSDKHLYLWQAILLSFAINLPFYETVLYNSIIFNPDFYKDKHVEFSVFFISCAIVGWLLMLIVFIVNKDNLKPAFSFVLKKLTPLHKTVKETIILGAIIILILFSIIYFTGISIKFITEYISHKYIELSLFTGLWVLIGILVFVISSIISF